MYRSRSYVRCAGNRMPGERATDAGIVYRFDDHRYLELKGWGCEGELWYTDTLRGIHTRPVSQFYRIFTKKFVHPSERYIAIPTWDDPGTMISKDYGKTWSPQFFSVGPNEPDGTNQPSYEDIISFTVVNDQGFCICHQSHLKTRAFCPVDRGLPIPWMTEWEIKPFEDPALLPGAGTRGFTRQRTVDDGMGIWKDN
ncbi:T6SS immunity protein Tli3 family protein [Enterobacter hormaechei]|uniref:T6SS immunity protein Tli3 family protein n=1 Tax=Enterobacter hormaechei TaxID=158836 RepID=UPI003C6C87A3